MPTKKKRKTSSKGSNTLKKVNRLAKQMYKNGKAGKTWQQCQKAAGKKIRKG